MILSIFDPLLFPSYAVPSPTHLLMDLYFHSLGKWDHAQTLTISKLDWYEMIRNDTLNDSKSLTNLFLVFTPVIVAVIIIALIYPMDTTRVTCFAWYCPSVAAHLACLLLLLLPLPCYHISTLAMPSTLPSLPPSLSLSHSLRLILMWTYLPRGEM